MTLPANADCTITTIRSIDSAFRAASGRPEDEDVDRTPPGASGTSKAARPVVSLKPKAPKEGTMDIAEQIKAFEKARETKSGRMAPRSAPMRTCGNGGGRSALRSAL